jgi:prepilin-type N-terminal cleavage/methylation domain-containing protein
MRGRFGFTVHSFFIVSVWGGILDRIYMGSKCRGFTLIELLIVIAVIAILAAIIFVSLSASRGAAANKKIISELEALAGQAEVYHEKNRDYGSSALTCSAGMFADPEMARFINSFNSLGGYSVNTICHSNGTDWVVMDDLRIEENDLNDNWSDITYKYWCVDSAGRSKGRVARIWEDTTFDCLGS